MKKLFLILMLSVSAALSGCSSSTMTKPMTFSQYYAYVDGVELSVLNSVNAALTNKVISQAQHDKVVSECRDIDKAKQAAKAIYRTSQADGLSSIQAVLNTVNAITVELINMGVK